MDNKATTKFRITNLGEDDGLSIDVELTEAQYDWLTNLIFRLNTAEKHGVAPPPVISVYRLAWHPVFGEYGQDNTRMEHLTGEHDAHPDPESCAMCAADCGCRDMVACDAHRIEGAD